MKIAIDARLYGLEHAGPGRYVSNLVNELANIDKSNTYEILLRKKYYDELKLPSKWHKHLVDVRHYSFNEQLVALRVLNKINPDITHFPHFNIPVLYNKPFVTTIHDLSKHKSKGKESTTLPYLGYLIKRLGYNTVFSASVYKSKAIIVPSMFVKDDLLQHYKVSDNKITVTYEGVTSINKSKKASISDKYSLSAPYFLFIGSAYPHKNLERLVQAIVLLNQSYSQKVILAISSSRSIFTERLEKLIFDNKASEYTKLLGFVPDEDLYHLYNQSVGLVYPTLMEGFGLPGLEAMKSDTLVLASDIPVLKEIYKDNAIYFNPYDYNAITKAMEHALTISNNERKRIINKANKFVDSYSWKKMAQETLKIYESCVSL